MENGKDILIVAEAVNGAPVALAFEMLGLARQLAASAAGGVCVVTLGEPAPAATQALIAHGADRILVLPDAAPADYPSDAWLARLGAALAQVSARVVLIGHTPTGADLAPRLAFRLGSAIATGSEKLVLKGDALLATRPCYGNKAREVISLLGAQTIVTIRAKTQESAAPDPARRGEVLRLEAPPAVGAPPSQITAREQEDAAGGARLENANVVIAGGRGLGGPEGFKVLEGLASVLGGAVGASRVACDLGWCPHARQIGLTGKTVTPELYIAVGISGASHHMAGCGNAKAILAINSDPEAAIFKEARFGVVGDYKEIVPLLADAIARRRQATAGKSNALPVPDEARL